MSEVKSIDEIKDKWEVFKAVNEYLHYFFVFKDFVFISEKPTELHFKGAQLHNEKSMACKYSDGWGIYSLNGVSVSKKIVETTAEKLDAHLLLTEKNAEVRREIVRKIGVERICQKLGAQIIEKGIDQIGQPCELLNLNLGDGRFRPYIKLLNPSIGTYCIEGVRPECDTLDKVFVFRNGTKECPTIVT